MARSGKRGALCLRQHCTWRPLPADSPARSQFDVLVHGHAREPGPVFPLGAPCTGLQCETDIAFERQVAAFGARLAESAYAANPGLKQRIRAFDFIVADKREAGSASDASGSVAIFRGVRTPHLDEGALAFLIAREMGHVIARHHDEKTAARVIATIMSQLVMPIANLTPGSEFVAGSAVSTVGAKMITAPTDTARMREANAIALDLLARQGWRPAEVAKSLAVYAADLGNDPWSQEVKDAVGEFEKGAHAVFLV